MVGDWTSHVVKTERDGRLLDCRVDKERGEMSFKYIKYHD